MTDFPEADLYVCLICGAGISLFKPCEGLLKLYCCNALMRFEAA